MLPCCQSSPQDLELLRLLGSGPSTSDDEAAHCARHWTDSRQLSFILCCLRPVPELPSKARDAAHGAVRGGSVECGHPDDTWGGDEATQPPSGMCGSVSARFSRLEDDEPEEEDEDDEGEEGGEGDEGELTCTGWQVAMLCACVGEAPEAATPCISNQPSLLANLCRKSLKLCTQSTQAAALRISRLHHP